MAGEKDLRDFIDENAAGPCAACGAKEWEPRERTGALGKEYGLLYACGRCGLVRVHHIDVIEKQLGRPTRSSR